MRDIEARKDPDSLKAGGKFDVDLQLRYLSPGAFTVLPPDEMPPPDPPQAPVPYRLSPTTRRNRNQAFSIIAEPSSRDASRSPSPTGRISPFRGRGFNPSGSRHISPAPTPPPGLAGGVSKPPKTPTKKSRIPQMNRRNSSVLFGEKVTHSEQSSDSSPSKSGLSSKLSRSMTNINSSVGSNKPPPSPQKGLAKNPAFRQLSPIVGSSPEPSQSQSSPSRIPTRSRSQPQSRLSSPTRPSVTTKAKLPSRTTRSTSRVQSRNASREPSPSGKSSVPLKFPGKYQNVQSKVNSFSKPKVPPKPPLTSDSELSDKPATKTPKYKKQINNKVANSVKKNENHPTVKSKFNNNSSNNAVNSNNKNNIKKNEKNVVDNKHIMPDVDTIVKVVEKISPKKKTNTTAEDKTKNENIGLSSTRVLDENSNLGETISEFSTEAERLVSDLSVKISDLLNHSSTASIVPTTTSTVTKPLKINTSVETSKKDLPRGISPMVDGRVLSATSVSQAMNKMNDTVLNTKTLIRESGLSKLSPAASAIISMSRENTSYQSPNKNIMKGTETTENKHVNIRNDTNSLNTTDDGNGKSLKTDASRYKINNGNLDANNINNGKNNDNDSVGNHVTSTGLMDAKTLEMHVQNNISKKLIAAENDLNNFVHMGESEKIRESRNVFAPELKPVQPIHILVKEKPSDQDVESGNVRFPVSATNGSFHGRPSLPPDPQPNSNNTATKEQQSPNKDNETNSRTAKFFSSAKKHLLCKTCKKNSTEEATNVPAKRLEDETEEKKGCFSCLKKRQHFEQNIRIKVEEDGKELKESCWDRLKCCRRKNKIVEKQGCLSFGKGKSAWKERRDSILSDVTNRPTCSNRCKNFMKKLLCLHLCKKKKSFEDLSVSRRASMLSKKKSLTPTTQPVEDQTPKLDLSLVEHTSHMKAAIPVLPICLAWFCLVLNCLLPGTGTIMSGLFCLCIGKPRFSQKDSIRSRIGAFIIDCIVGASQTFTILFCLVGWGWSIWWGIIMVKLARKYKKIKILADAEEAGGKRSSIINQSTRFRDPERGS